MKIKFNLIKDKSINETHYKLSLQKHPTYKNNNNLFILYITVSKLNIINEKS